jgi:hypothetical protein
VTTIDDCRLVELPTIVADQGSITPVEGGTTIPFEIERVYYVYDVIGGASRGAHAHRELQQLLVAAMGGFTVTLDDGVNRRDVHLNRAYQGLYIPRLIWRELVDFSSGGICVALASLPYDPDDYIRDYDEYLSVKQAVRSAGA